VLAPTSNMTTLTAVAQAPSVLCAPRMAARMSSALGLPNSIVN
jgi:hypothetical protein